MVGVAGVDRSDERVDEALEHLFAESITDETTEAVVIRWGRAFEEVEARSHHADRREQA
ncbi:unannotated protein [freshwater metagenome]|uniref:Unannotated protein n=1 Tax=freshwater metagenome TaxID=449393 RepID=A0A6J7EJD9_9ZZZZ